MPIEDYQQSNFYKAERDALLIFDDTMNLTQSIETIGRIIDSPFVKSLYEEYGFIQKPTNYTVMKGEERFCYTQTTNKQICLPVGSRNIPTICHEVAHCLTSNKKLSPHGREFCFVYLELIKKFMGGDFYYSLLEQYEDYDIDY